MRSGHLHPYFVYATTKSSYESVFWHKLCFNVNVSKYTLSKIWVLIYFIVNRDKKVYKYVLKFQFLSFKCVVISWEANSNKS